MTSDPASTAAPAKVGPLAAVPDAFASYDRVVDDLLEPLRERAAIRHVFTWASHLADFSLIWHVIGITRGIVRRRPDQAVALAVALGIESLVVNQGVKRLFRRERPTTVGDPRSPVRRPTTSSFPSGHASSAAFAATILTGWDRQLAPLWWGIAKIVGASRAVVRIHHASDVVVGAALGWGMGVVARRILRRIVAP